MDMTFCGIFQCILLNRMVKKYITTLHKWSKIHIYSNDFATLIYSKIKIIRKKSLKLFLSIFRIMIIGLNVFMFIHGYK